MADTNLQAAADVLFEAMDILTAKRMSNLNYDKTIICDIESVEDADTGAYRVSDGSTSFIAYSQDTEYEVGERVHVTVPGNNMENQKRIVGRYVTVATKAVKSISPLEYMIDVTGNIIESSTGEVGVMANAGTINGTRVVWESGACNYMGYQMMGLSIEFKSILPTNTITGTFGVVLRIENETKTGNITYHDYAIDSTELFGNPYRLVAFSKKEQVYNIKELYKIKKITLLLTQLNDFTSDENKPIVSATNNIFVRNAFISFGYDISEVNSERIILGTFGSTSYGDDGDNGERDVFMRWIHKEDGRFRSIDVESEIPSNAKIRWYRYKLEPNRKDDLAGDFWRDITEDEIQDLFNHHFTADGDTHMDGYKVIVEYPSTESVIAQLKVDEAFDNSEGNLSAAIRAVLEADGDPIDKVEEFANDFIALLDIVDLTTLEKEYNKIIEKLHQYPGTSETDNLFSVLYNQIINKRQETRHYGVNDELLFYNSKSQTELAIDLVQGLQIEVDQEGRKGIYLLYDEAGEIISSSEANKSRYLVAKYSTVSTGVEVLDAAEEITWYIPATNTMVEFPVEGVEYILDNGDTFITETECGQMGKTGYVGIRRMGSENAGSLDSETRLIQSEQTFRIKNFYTYSGNNTILCEIKKAGKIYRASADLIFDTMGSNGTDATFILKMYNVGEGNAPVYNEPKHALSLGNTVAVVPFLYDATGAEVELEEGAVEFAWKEQGTGIEAQGISLNTIGNNAVLRSMNEDIHSHECYILQASTVYKIIMEEYKDEETGETKQRTRNVKLTAYLPIAIAASDTFAQIQGATKIIYNSLGAKPKYYREPYRIYAFNNLGEAEDGVRWEIYTADESNTALPFYPTLNTSYALEAKNMFCADLAPFCVRCLRSVVTVEGEVEEIIWSNPILMIQNSYGSAILNNWDGNLTIDEKNGTILSTMVGAGKKNEDNTFSGVLMGDMGMVGDSANQSGLGMYGIHHGDQSFGFNIDGTAFLGKSGSGRISFEGNEGTITSGNYDSDVAGMKIDLDEPYIRAYGPAGGFEMDLSEQRDNQINYELLRIFGRENKENGETDIKNIMVVGNNEYYLQTMNFNTEDTTGVKFDLGNGRLIGHDFELLAKSKIVDGEGNELYPFVQLSSSGSPYFKVHHAGAANYEEVEVYEVYPPSEGQKYFTKSIKTDGSVEYKEIAQTYKQCLQTDIYVDGTSYFKLQNGQYVAATRYEFDTDPTKCYTLQYVWRSDLQYYVEHGDVYEPIKLVEEKNIYQPNTEFYVVGSGDTVDGYIEIKPNDSGKVVWNSGIQYYIKTMGVIKSFEATDFTGHEEEFYRQVLTQEKNIWEYYSKYYENKFYNKDGELLSSAPSKATFEANKANYWHLDFDFEPVNENSYYEKGRKYYHKVNGEYEPFTDNEISFETFKEERKKKDTIYIKKRKYIKCGNNGLGKNIYQYLRSNVDYYQEVYVSVKTVSNESYKYYQPNTYFIISSTSSFIKEVGADTVFDSSKEYYTVETGYTICTSDVYDSNTIYYTYSDGKYNKVTSDIKDNFAQAYFNYYVETKYYYKALVLDNTKYMTFSDAKATGNLVIDEGYSIVKDDKGQFDESETYYQDSNGTIQLEVVDNTIYKAVFEVDKYYYKDSNDIWIIAKEYNESTIYYTKEVNEGVETTTVITLAPPGSIIYKANTFYIYKSRGFKPVASDAKYVEGNRYYLSAGNNTLNYSIDIVNDDKFVYKPETYYLLNSSEIKYELASAALMNPRLTYYQLLEGNYVLVKLIDEPYYDYEGFSFSGVTVFNPSTIYYRYYTVSGNYVLAEGDFDNTTTYYRWNTDGYVPYESGKYYIKNAESYNIDNTSSYTPGREYYIKRQKSAGSTAVYETVKMIESIEEDKKTYNIVSLYDPKLQYSAALDPSNDNQLYTYNDSNDSYSPVPETSTTIRGIPYFIKVDGPIENDLITMTKNKFELKSHEWNRTAQTGAHFNFSGGAYLEGYGEYKSSQTGEIRRPKFILDWRKNHSPIDVNDGVFEVKWNGEVICNNIKAIGGSIGGWNISSTGISKGTFKLYSYGGKTGFYSGADAENSDYIINMEKKSITDTGDKSDSTDVPIATDTEKSAQQYFILKDDGSIQTHSADIANLTAATLKAQNFYLGTKPVTWKKKSVVTSVSGSYGLTVTKKTISYDRGGTTYSRKIVTDVSLSGSTSDSGTTLVYLG